MGTGSPSGQGSQEVAGGGTVSIRSHRVTDDLRSQAAAANRVPSSPQSHKVHNMATSGS
eukprot:gene860-5672_t